LATVKAPLRVPPAIEHVDPVTGEPESEQDVSVLRKLVPVTCTICVGLAEVGLKVIAGAAVLTLKVADAESPIWLPVAVTV
jgi:hypothetical protein